VLTPQDQVDTLFAERPPELPDGEAAVFTRSPQKTPDTADRSQKRAR